MGKKILTGMQYLILNSEIKKYRKLRPDHNTYTKNLKVIEETDAKLNTTVKSSSNKSK